MCHSAARALDRLGPITPRTAEARVWVSFGSRIPASVRASSSAAARPAFHGVIAAFGVVTAEPADGPPGDPAGAAVGGVVGEVKSARMRRGADARRQRRAAGRRGHLTV